jgi:hypothetical protein
MNFHEVLDEVFDKICTKYGAYNDIIKQKEQLKYVYDNESKWRSEEILKAIKPKQWYIDEKGIVIRVA